MNTGQRRTKIVCTLCPSSNSKEQITKLVQSGMNVARINFSHGDHEGHGKVIRIIREVAEEQDATLAILADLQGPKIRVGQMKDGAQPMQEGSYVTLTPDDSVEGTSELIPIDYAGLPDDAVAGDRVLMDDGLLGLKIIKKEDRQIIAQVIDGGMLKSRKGVNLPGVNISMASLTPKDIEDLEFAVSQDVDYLAMSFVRTAADIQEVVSRVRAQNSQARVIAKIEKPEAVTNINEIIDEADGIMVARGDLGIEIASEQVPLVQNRIIERCRRVGKPAITATQMLDSMIENPRATRAENSDVANAVLDGTDAVMLSGETAAGNYPVEAVKTMDRICRSVETNAEYLYDSLEYSKPEWKEKQVVESLAYSCVSMGPNIDARVIGTLTNSGNTARRVAKFRPHVPIIAFTDNTKVCNQLALVWGVQPVMIEAIFDTDKSVRLMEGKLKEAGLVNSGDRIILTTGMPLAERGRTNMLKVSIIE